MAKALTVLELINRLEKLAADSPLGDGTVVVLSVTGSPYAHVTDVLLESDVTIPGPNGLILLNVDESMLEIEADLSESDRHDICDALGSYHDHLVEIDADAATLRNLRRIGRKLGAVISEP